MDTFEVISDYKFGLNFEVDEDIEKAFEQIFKDVD